MKNYKELEFTNPVFHEGVNITVRRGTKWSDNSVIPFIKFGQNSRKALETSYRRVIKFNELTDADLVFEHDPKCRTVDGLAEVLKEVYPTFTREDTVTIIYFILNFRKPVVGDWVFVPDMAPAYIGEIESVIELDSNFWECAILGVVDKTGDEQRVRIIVHESEFHYDIFGDGKVSGWYTGNQKY